MIEHPQKINLEKAPWLSSKAVQDVFRALDVPGEETRIVGGAVRNALIGEPVNDIDIATTLHPTEVVKQAELFGLKSVPTGIKHGTVTLLSEGEGIEVTTLRADVDTDGRHAKVEFGRDWSGDAARRDFTINAIYCNNVGDIFDPLGGIEDLKNRRLKFIGDPKKRVQEDYLRILRFIRFHGAFAEGPIDRDGIRACLKERSGLGQLSRERIWAEFSKILNLHNAVETIGLMYDYGLLTTILRGVPNLSRFKNIVATEEGLALSGDVVRRLGALTLFVEGDASRLAETFRLSQKDMRRLSAMAKSHSGISWDMDEKSAQRLIYTIGKAEFEDQLLLSVSGNSGEAAGREIRELAKLYELAQTWQPKSFPVTGADLLGLGLTPGPNIGRLLSRLENHWVDADFEPGREALLNSLQAMVSDLDK